MSTTILELPIEQLHPPVSNPDIADLGALLLDAIEDGAAVSFMAGLAQPEAEAWWRSTIAGAHAGAVFLVARDERGIVGSVQMHPAWAPNQPHRADVVKLLVHRRARRQRLGTRLMAAIEAHAREGGFTLLTLDAKRGGAAERLYHAAGWTRAGAIPHYALDTDGATLHDTVLFYKELG